MEDLAKHYNIKTCFDMYCLDDIASNLIKTSRKSLYMSKIKEKHKIDDKYYITEQTFINLLKKARSETGQKAYELYFSFLNNNQSQNNQSQNNQSQNNQSQNNQSQNNQSQNNQSQNNQSQNIAKFTDQSAKTEIKNTEILTDFRSQFMDYEGCEVHIIIINDEYWFRGTHICKILEYEEPTKAYKLMVKQFKSEISNLLRQSPLGALSKDNTKLKNIKPTTLYVSYPGLYQLCMLSKKPKARNFQIWICAEVIPSILKTGSYIAESHDKIQLPFPSYKEIDLNDHIGQSCIYLIHVIENLYKIGWTHKILRRFSDHKKNYDYEKIIKVYQLENNNDCLNVETKIKAFLRENKMMASHERQKKLIKQTVKKSAEMFEINDKFTIQHIIKKIDHYINVLKEENTKRQIIAGRTLVADNILENVNISDIVKIKRLDIENNSICHAHELKKMEHETHKMECEIYKLELECKLKNIPFERPRELFNNGLCVMKQFDNNDTCNSDNDDDYFDDESICSYNSDKQVDLKILPFTSTIQPPINNNIIPSSPQKSKGKHIFDLFQHTIKTQNINQNHQPDTEHEKAPKKHQHTTKQIVQTQQLVQNSQPQSSQEDEIIDLESDEFFQMDFDKEDKNEQLVKSHRRQNNGKEQLKVKNLVTNEEIPLPASKYSHTTGRVPTKEKVKKRIVARSDKLCPQCNHQLTMAQGKCDWCPRLETIKESVKKGRPSYLTLKKEIEASSMCEVGRKYKVSDNCIRKWLKTYIKYGLTNN